VAGAAGAAGAGCACPGCAIIGWTTGATCSCAITCCKKNGTACTGSGSRMSSGCTKGGGGGTFNPASTASSIR